MEALQQFLELFLMERVRWGVDCAGSGGSRFENYSFERRCFFGVMEEMMANLGNG